MDVLIEVFAPQKTQREQQITYMTWNPLLLSWNCILVQLRVSLPKTGPLRFGSENQFPLNFAHEYILVQK